MNDVREELEFILWKCSERNDPYHLGLRSAMNAMVSLSDRELEITARRATRTADSFKGHARAVGNDPGDNYLLGISAAFRKLHRIYENYIRRTFL